MIKDKDVKRGNMKRVFLIVLDSFGIGEMEDAASYGDKGTNTLRSVAESPFLHIPNMRFRLGESGRGRLPGKRRADSR